MPAKLSPCLLSGAAGRVGRHRRRVKASGDAAFGARRRPSDSWSANSSEVADSLSTTSMEVAEHFVDLAGRQFNGLECGSRIYMWWTGDSWQTFPAKYLFRDHSLLVSMLRDGKAELRHWQAQGWNRTHPNEFQGGIDGFHRLQMIAKLEGVDASGAPARRATKASAAKKHANVVDCQFPQARSRPYLRASP